MTRSGGVARGTAINLATRLLAVGLVLLITAFTARLGTEKQGAFALFTSVEGVLLALLSGFGIALARRVSHHGEQPRELLVAIVVACIGLGAMAALVLWAVSAFGPPAYSMLWLLALAAPLLLLAPNLAGLWLGEGRMLPMAAVSLAPPLLTLLGLAALLAVQAASLPQVLASWVVAKVLVGAAVLVVMARSGRLAAPGTAGFGALRAELPFIATIGLTNLIGLLNYRVGLFVIERLLGLSATGVYSIAVVVAELLWFVSGSLTQAVYGRIGTPDRARAAATTVRVVHLSLLALLLVAPLLALVAVAVIPRVLGPAYAASLPLLAWLLPGALVFGGASALSAYFTNHAGRPQVPAQVAAVSLALNATLALTLVPLMGMAGAALAASLSYTASVLLLAWRFARHAGLPLVAVLWPGAQLKRDLLALRRGGG
jgi:O-antigen/teichoic acid export membrane protein